MTTSTPTYLGAHSQDFGRIHQIGKVNASTRQAKAASESARAKLSEQLTARKTRPMPYPR